jgi:hypothetical protein
MSDQPTVPPGANLPALPDPSAPITLAELERIEARVASTLPAISDVGELEEGRAQAEALAAYLERRGLHRTMLGIQRRIEARIGQLLGPTTSGKRHDLEPSVVPEGLIDRHERQDFRTLARALDGEIQLEADEWRVSRRMLVERIREADPPRGASEPEPPPRVSVQVEHVRARKTAREEFADSLHELGRASAKTERRTNAIEFATEQEIYRWRDQLAEIERRVQVVRQALSAVRGG